MSNFKDLKISKELLSEVLKLEVVKHSLFNKLNKSFNITYMQSEDSLKSSWMPINIYEFAFKCKEWAYENNYYVYSTPSFALEGVAYIVEDNNIGKRLKTLQLDSEVEAIIQACEWILREVNK